MLEDSEEFENDSGLGDSPPLTPSSPNQYGKIMVTWAMKRFFVQIKL